MISAGSWYYLDMECSPGPWRADLYEDGEWWINSASDRPIAIVSHTRYSKEHALYPEADARLMAAAPEMYDLLDTLAEYEPRWSCTDQWCEELLPKLHALLARIDGKETP